MKDSSLLWSEHQAPPHVLPGMLLKSVNMVLQLLLLIAKDAWLAALTSGIGPMDKVPHMRDHSPRLDFYTAAS